MNSCSSTQYTPRTTHSISGTGSALPLPNTRAFSAPKSVLMKQQNFSPNSNALRQSSQNAQRQNQSLGTAQNLRSLPALKRPQMQQQSQNQSIQTQMTDITPQRRQTCIGAINATTSMQFRALPSQKTEKSKEQFKGIQLNMYHVILLRNCFLFLLCTENYSCFFLFF